MVSMPHPSGSALTVDVGHEFGLCRSLHCPSQRGRDRGDQRDRTSAQEDLRRRQSDRQQVPAEHRRDDAADATDAASRPTIRFVPGKSTGQQDVQLLHRARERPVRQLTAPQQRGWQRSQPRSRDIFRSSAHLRYGKDAADDDAGQLKRRAAISARMRQGPRVRIRLPPAVSLCVRTGDIGNGTYLRHG